MSETPPTDARGASWRYVVRIGDLFYDAELTFAQKRDGIVARLRSSSAMRPSEGPRGQELSHLVDELAEADDIELFDWIMSDIYDLADRGKWLWVGP